MLDSFNSTDLKLLQNQTPTSEQNKQNFATFPDLSYAFLNFPYSSIACITYRNNCEESSLCTSANSIMRPRLMREGGSSITTSYA